MNTFKRIIALVMVSVMVALCLASCGDGGNSSVPEGMKEASGDSVDYNFYVPSGWICDTANGATSAYYSETDRSNVSVMSFSTKYSDDTLADWWKNYEADFKSVYTDFKEISKENIIVDGVAALKTVFQGTLEGYTYQFMQVAAVKDVFLSKPQIYIFTYTSVPEAYESHLEDVQSMIDAFDFHDTDVAESAEG